MTQPKLFTPIRLGGLELPNRVVVSPMCQYSAVDGVMQPWHHQHLGSLAASGPGLIIIEATAVEAIGRITPGDVGLYDDATEQAIADVLSGIRTYAGTPIGIQLAHAGFKASSRRPWEGGTGIPVAEGGWVTAGPSAVVFDETHPAPAVLDQAGLARVREAFVAAARRSDRIGLDAIELHAAHGYLLHEFLSPISNLRTDGYGGSRENRMRFPLEIAEAVRAVWPRGKALGMRITGTDWVDEGWTPDDAVALAKRLKEVGLDFVTVSSGGIRPGVRIPVGPGYQVHLAQKVQAEAGIPTQAVGLIVEPRQAEEIVASGKADMVAIARGFLDDPRWVWHAAEALGADAAYVPQYLRARRDTWPGAEQARPLRAVAAE